ncbi:Neu5Ac permease [Variovorax sp. PBS-H4]|uniref:TRAP transporter large permease n=1 Tax=Variovorax sp. PBS-H4 TaxID=434008 RepID=UPI0013170349|nr:TRAP transporter large permease [Variovorax sp. PBS-H4]VTU34316.1 Neu5Ac permease [Variovorax sp. PBS-H4]
MSGGAAFSALVIAGLIFLVLIGIPVVTSLGVASVVGLAVLTQSADIAFGLLGTTAFEAIRGYVFAVIPLFVLMGELIARSGAAADLFTSLSRLLKRVPGSLAVSTVAGNAVFAAVVGVSVASAAAFSRIAYPVMVKAGYDKRIALGCVAGSSALGMLIPPSVLMIIWGILTQQSIGKLFVAGVIPGLLLALCYAVLCVVRAIVSPEKFGKSPRATEAVSPAATPATRDELLGSFGCGLAVFTVLGGIWAGLFTPTEGAGIGVIVALVLSLAKGMRWAGLRAAILATGRTSAPIMFLLIFAQMYSRLLALGGVGETIQVAMAGLGLGAGMVIVVMVLVWFVLGMFVDSTSIILLTVPIFAPLAQQMGIDPLAFAIIGILAIEVGIITPPFGIAVFTVKAAINEPQTPLSTIFLGAAPYWVLLLGMVAAVYWFPSLASWLPSVN